MRTICVIQARLGSLRLPRKVLADIAGRPMLARVVERARAIRGVDEVIVAVPSEEQELWEMAVREGWGPFRSSLLETEDVLGRFMRCVELLEELLEAEGQRPDVVVRLTGDCPLLAPDVAELALTEFHRQGVDYLGTTHPLLAYPDGMDVEIVSRTALRTAHREATDPEDREHVTRFLWRQPERFKIGRMLMCCGASGCLRSWMLADEHCQPNHCAALGLKASVDTTDDLSRVRGIYSYLPEEDFLFEATLRAARAAGVLR